MATLRVLARCVCLAALLLSTGALAAEPGPAPATVPSPLARLPHYDVDIQLDLAQHIAHVHQVVTWINDHQRPTAELVFNAHSHYKVPDGQTVLIAKTLEILRMSPSEAYDRAGAACQIERVLLPQEHGGSVPLPFHFQQENATALVATLPAPIGPGEAVTVQVDFTMRLPQKYGRWGQWDGVTTLSNWLPVLAYYDELGWQPTPFVPWHQPFFNEAGIYRVRVTLPADQKVACSGSVVAVHDLPDGLKQVEISAVGVRDFALLCSARYCEYTAMAGSVRVKILAFPEHEFHGRTMLQVACEAIPAYSRWFGPYPWPEFTVAESFFGWNGNECSTLVMIDERVFGMPHLASGYIEYLLSHEICHQWWYNLIGTNGYCETWMDEGMATYFAHRLLNQKHGRNNKLLNYPTGLEWLPNISRENYRNYSYYGTLARHEQGPVLQEIPKFDHLINLFSMCYDRGSKVVGMIEDQMGGEAPFLEFMHQVYAHYQFRVLRVADFQHELEVYSGKSWEEFFHHWLKETGTCDWCVEDVHIHKLGTGPADGDETPTFLGALHRGPAKGPCRVTVFLRQKAEYNEQTVLGFSLDDSPAYQVRVPILPQAGLLQIDDPPARIEMLPDNRVRVEVTLPCEPTQISVDPDQILVDRDPSNNHWKPQIRWRFTPLYTLLDETSLTTDYDRWNVICGPWFFDSAYNDPWYTRSAMVGARAGLFRTEEFNGGAYAAYRFDFRDIVVGVDGLLDHFPWPHTQVGFNAEQRLATVYSGDQKADRAALFGRYVFNYGASLYLPPMHFLEVFAQTEDNFLPLPRNSVAGAERFDRLSLGGIHYHLNYFTPYWDPEEGFQIDATYQGGAAQLGSTEGANLLTGQVAAVQSMPEGLGWLSQTRLVGRLFGAAALPNKGEFFTLGGSDRFRGFDLAERQGSIVWVASAEWRVPVAKDLTCDALDHTIGLRNLYAVAFYDAGDAMTAGHSVGPVAHAVGAGLGLDIALFSFIERTTLRFDVAKTVNADTPWQFWFSFRHPF